MKRSRRLGLFSGTSATLQLVAINVVIYVLVLVALLVANYRGGESEITRFVSFVAVNPSLVMQGYFWTLLTSVFVHLSFSHLLVNMLSLFFVGSFVERLIGRKRYIWFYLISGVVGSLFFVLFGYLGSFTGLTNAFGSVNDYAVGASGAIFGIAGLLAVLLPRLKVLVFFVIPMPLWAAMVFFIVGLWVISAFAGLPIGNSAHLGGILVGLLYGVYLRLNYPRKVDLLNKMFRS